MKRSIAIILSLVMATVFSACGNNNGGENSETVSNTATVPKTDIQEKVKSVFEESFQSHGFNGTGYLVYKGEEIYSGVTGKANKKEDIDNRRQRKNLTNNKLMIA